MTPELWNKVFEAWDEYFSLAADCRTDFLKSLLETDPELAAELESLLRQRADQNQHPLSAPPGDVIEQAAESKQSHELRGPATVEYAPEARQSAARDDESTVTPDGDSAKDARTSPRLPPDIPARAGQYTVEEIIGKGGMGAVLRVRDPDFERTLAVKVMLPKAKRDPDMQRRFLEEAKITGQLQHPGIPPVHEIGELEDGLPFFAMKLIEGKTLGELLKKREASGDASAPRDNTRFIGIFGQICQTIGYAHSRGVIHRDLKPANIMVGAFGEVQVMDWGLAKSLRQSRARKEADWPNKNPLSHDSGSDSDSKDRDPQFDYVHTEHGVAMGTPTYMAPEQARGEIDEIDAQSDVFGLGAILCQILTGRPAFTGSNVRDVLDQAGRGDLSDAQDRLDQCDADAELIELTKRCLAPEKAGRPKDGGEVAAAIEEYEANVQERLKRAEVERAQAEVKVVEERKRRKVEEAKAREERRRRRTQLIAAAAVLALLAIGVAGSAAGLYVLGQKNTQLETTIGQRDTAITNLKESNKNLNVARDEADKKRRIAEAVDQFLRFDLLQQADVRRQASRLLQLGGKQFQTAYDPKVSELLDRASAQLTPENIDKKFPGQPLVQARLLLTVGGAYRAIGEYDKAINQLDRAHKQFEKDLSVDHADTLISKNNLALVYLDAANFVKSLSLLEETLERMKEKLGVNHPLTLTCKNSLGVSYRAAGQLEKVIPFCTAAVEGRTIKLGHDHPLTLESMNNLAAGHFAIGEFDKALLLFEKCVFGMKAQLGVDHPDTLFCTNNLAMTYKSLGRSTEALMLYKETHKRIRAKFGDNHPYSLVSLNNLAECYNEAGQVDESLPLFVKAVPLLEQTVGRMKAKMGVDHRHTITSMNNLAMAYHAVGRFDKACTLLETTVARMKVKLGVDHPDTLTGMNNLATAYRSRGQLSKALPLLEESFNRRKTKLGADHPHTLLTMNNLAITYAALGNNNKAVPLFEETVKRMANKWGFDHPDTHNCMNNLALAYRDIGHLGKALPVWEEILEHMKAKLGSNHVDTLMSMNQLGGGYWEAGQLDKALPLLQQTLERRKVKLGRDHSLTLASTWNLSLVLRDAGHFAESAALLGKLVKLRSPTHPRYKSELRQLERVQRFLAQESRLSAILNGATTTAIEQLKLAYLCRRYLKRYRDAVTLYSAAFKADPNTANDLDHQPQFFAARAALLAAAGKGKDAAKIDKAEKAKLRRQALDWLNADIIGYGKLLETKPGVAVLVQERLKLWQKDADFESIRDAKPLAGLPDAERKFWQKLWSEVETLRKKARDSYTETEVKGILTTARRKHEHEANLSAQKTYVIDMQSKRFDTFLKIADAQGKLLAQNDDIDDKNNNLNSRITFTPKTTGKYRLIATSYNNEGTGPYEIIIRDFSRDKQLVKVTTLPAKKGKPKPPPVKKSPPAKAGPDDIQGKLTATDPLDIFSITKKWKSRRKVHEVPFDAGKTYQIALSGDFDTFLRIEDAAKKPLLYNDDVTPPGDLNSSLIFRPAKQGKYRIIVTSYKPATGAYALTIREVQTAGKPTQIQAELTNDDKNIGKRFADFHKVKLTAGIAYTFMMESKKLDTYLVLVNPAGKRIADNDDLFPGNTQLSRIDFTPAKSETYTVIATSFQPGQTGAYVLRVQGYQEKKTTSDGK